MGSILWVLESTEKYRFPYRVTIRKEGKVILALFV